MTLRHTREALGWILPKGNGLRRRDEALDEIVLAEAVIEAARRFEPWHEAAEARWMSMEDATIPVRARRIAEACRAVAALDAAEKEQD